MNHQYRLNSFFPACIFVAIILLSFCSCSDEPADYRTAIPRHATSLVRVDNTEALASLLSLPEPVVRLLVSSKSGLDVGRPFYLFTDDDGTFGFCAAVADGEKLTQHLDTFTRLHLVSKPVVHQGCTFVTISKKWTMAYSAHALLLLGPVAPGESEPYYRRMSRLLSAEKEESILKAPLFLQLESLTDKMALVTRVETLPTPLQRHALKGVPPQTVPSAVCVAARLSLSHGILQIDATPFSFSRTLNEAIGQHLQKLQPDTLTLLFQKDEELPVLSRLAGVSYRLRTEPVKIFQKETENQ